MGAAPHCPLQDNCLPKLTADRFPLRDFEQVDGLQEGEIWSGAAVINNLLHPWYILHVYLFLAVSLQVFCPIMRTGRVEECHKWYSWIVTVHLHCKSCQCYTTLGLRWTKGKWRQGSFSDDASDFQPFWKRAPPSGSLAGGRSLKGQAGISMRCGDRLRAAFHLIGSAGFLTVWRQRGSGCAHGIKNGASQRGGDALWLHKHIVAGSLIPAVNIRNCRENVLAIEHVLKRLYPSCHSRN